MDPTELMWIIFYIKFSHYVTLAGATIYFYDYFLTLSSEIKLFWNARGGRLLKLAVIIIRYTPMLGFPIALLGSSPFFMSLSTSACQFSLIGSVAFQILTCIATTCIFYLRVCTLYDPYPRVQWIIFSAFWICAASQIIISFFAMYMALPRIGSFHGYCGIIKPFTQNQIYIISASYITATPCEVVFILATLYHAIRTRRLVFTHGVVWPVLYRLYTDGALWFVIELCFRLWGCLQWLLCPKELKYVSDRLIYALQAVIAGRFFFVLREHIGNSALSSTTVVCVSPSGKAVVGMEMKSSIVSSFIPSTDTKGFNGDASISPAFNSTRPSQKDHSRSTPLDTMMTGIQRGYSTEPYPITTFDGEDMQISFVLSQEYQLEQSRSGSRRDESTVQSIDTSV